MANLGKNRWIESHNLQYFMLWYNNPGQLTKSEKKNITTLWDAIELYLYMVQKNGGKRREFYDHNEYREILTVFVSYLKFSFSFKKIVSQHISNCTSCKNVTSFQLIMNNAIKHDKRYGFFWRICRIFKTQFERTFEGTEHSHAIKNIFVMNISNL